MINLKPFHEESRNANDHNVKQLTMDVLKKFNFELQRELRDWTEYEEKLKEYQEWEDRDRARKEANTAAQKRQRERERKAKEIEDAREEHDPSIFVEKSKKNEEDIPEKAADYDDWDADNADLDPPPQHVENESNNTNLDDTNLDSRDRKKEEFNPDYEYIPDSTSNLMDWKGKPLPKFDKTRLPRNDYGGIAWEQVPKNVLHTMLVRMIALFLSNKRRNKKRNYFLKMLEHQLEIKKSYLDHDKRVMDNRNPFTTHGTGSTP